MAGIDPTGEPLAKGTAFLGILKYIKTQPNGEALLEKVLGQLSAGSQAILRRKVIAIGDYSYAAFVELLRKADQVLGRGDLALCRTLGKYTATRDVQSIYNLYKKQAKPEDLMRDGAVIWKSYYQNAGTFKTEDSSPDHILVRIIDFPRMDPAHCRLMEGWMTQAVQESGGVWIEELREVQCMSRGGPYHEFTGRWKAGPAK